MLQQEVLLKNLPPPVANNVQFGKKLIDIVPSDDPGGAFCKFSDNTVEGPFDMIIGCDGIKSPVKEYIETGAIQKVGNTGIYSGIRIKWAVKDGKDDDKERPTTAALTQYFADGVYGLGGIYGTGAGKPPSKCALLISLDPAYFGPFKKKDYKEEITIDENADWAQDVRKKLEEGQANMLAQVRSSNLTYFELEPTISNADRFFEIGVYFHNPFTLKGWSKEISKGSSAVLCGDAAHAMPPFLGQGANQAIQDAYTLSKVICEHNTMARGSLINAENENKTLTDLLKDYERTRWPPTASITVKSVVLGYLETGGFGGAYAKFRDVFFRFMGSVGVATKVLLDAATPKL